MNSKRILTVTLNPAIDKRYEIEEFKLGSVMRVRSCINNAGGKGLNVTKVLKILGANVIATGIIGGSCGGFIESELRNSQIENEFLRVEQETRTCINFYDCKSGVQSEFLEPGNCVHPDTENKFIEHFKNLIEGVEMVVMSGSAVPGISKEIYYRLIKLCKERNIKTILDASGEYLRQGILANPYLVKPNVDEIGQLLSKPVRDIDEIIHISRAYLESGIDKFAVSLGGDGAVLTSGDSSFIGAPPKINAVNTVGCGDDRGFRLRNCKRIWRRTIIKVCNERGGSKCAPT